MHQVKTTRYQRKSYSDHVCNNVVLQHGGLVGRFDHNRNLHNFENFKSVAG